MCSYSQKEMIVIVDDCRRICSCICLRSRGDTLGSLVCTYLKRMHQEQRLISTGLRDICWLHTIRHLHNSHSAPYLPLKILHNLCFSFLLGITAIPREIENNAYANFLEEIRCIMGDVQVAYKLS